MPADDRWNTESRSAYVYYVADPTGAPPPPPPSHPVSKAPRLKPRPSAEEWKEMASAPPAGDGDEWVLVDVVPQDGSSSPRKKKKVVLRKRRKAGKKSKQAKSLPVTRNMTDTKFAETFNKPIPHLYGRNNTNPATDDNYLRTHNVMERRPSQVYDSAKQAMDRPAYNPPKPPPRKHELKSDEDDYRICDKITQINHALVECDKPRGHDENMTFGDASKPRSEEPSMYEVLSWHDSSYVPYADYPQIRNPEPPKPKTIVVPFSPPKKPAVPPPEPVYVYKFVPTEHEELDPKNYAGKPLGALKSIPAAGDPTRPSVHFGDLYSF